MLYLGMSSSAQIDLFIEYFIKTFQDDDDFEKIFSKLFENLLASSAVCEKLASNDDFEIVVR